VRSANFRPVYRVFFWILVLDVLVLGYVGGAEPVAVNVVISQIAAAYYFAFFLIIVPIISRLERPRPLPNSITEAVLKGESGSRVSESAVSA